MSMNNFKSALLDAFIKQKNCDVQFVCPDPSSTSGKSSIKAHKLILSLASDVFDAMFYGEASKNEAVENSNVVKIDDIEMPAFKMFLSCIYAKSVKFESPEQVGEFYHAADKYNCKDALELCHTYMMDESSDADNAIVFYDIARLYDIKDVQEACIKVFSENTSDVIASPKFMTTTPETIRTIFEMSALNIVSDLDLMWALERYIKHNEKDDPEIAEKVRPALNFIRFLTLDPKDIARSTLLTPEEIKDVIESLPPNGDLSKMPLSLSVIKEKRDRACNKTEKVMIRALSDVFQTKACLRCIAQGQSHCHAIWNCGSALDQQRRTSLKNVYDKYKHVALMDYETDDLKTIYSIYKAFNYVK